jgi:hypothetical protein
LSLPALIVTGSGVRIEEAERRGASANRVSLEPIARFDDLAWFEREAWLEAYRVNKTRARRSRRRRASS